MRTKTELPLRDEKETDTLRKSGIEAVGNIPWGSHLCQFYEAKEDLIDILVPYFAVGLRNNEFCMWVISEPLSEEEAKKAMRRAVPNFDRYLKRGQIEIVPHTEWYLKEGAFNLQRVLNAWIDKLDQALAKGYDGIRVTGNTAWLEKRDWRSFADYEEEVNHAIGKYRMMAICTYSLDKCGASEVIDVVRSHQFALIKRRGGWELIESSGLKRAKEALKRSEVRLKNILAASPDAITVSDLDGNIIECNQATLDMGGFSSKDEVIGRNALEFIAEKDRERAMKNLKKTLEQGSVRNIEYTFLTKDGREFPAELSASIIKDSSGNPTGFVAVTKDITERKKAEKEIRKVQERFSGIYNSSKDAIGYASLEGVLLDVNDSFCKLTGYSREELLTRKQYQDITPKEYHEYEAKIIERILRTGKPAEYEKEYIRKDGSRVPILLTTFVVKGDDGKPIGLAAIIKDITERKKMEAALAHERDLLHALMDNIPDAIYFKDAASRFTRVNRAHAQRMGVNDPREAVGKTDFDFYPEEFAREAYADEQRIVKTGEPLINKVEKIRRADGQFRWVSATKVPIMDKEGQVTGIVGISRDITERKKAEERIRESEEKYRNLFENARDAIVTFDLKGNVTSTNKAVFAEYGFKEEEFIGKNMLKFVRKKYWPRLLRELAKLARGESVEGEIEVFTSRGKRIADYRSNPIRRGEKVVGFQTVLRDITERKQAEEALRESEERLRQLIEYAPEAIYVNDLKGNFIDGNKQAENLTGYKKEELIGKSMLKVGLLPRKYVPNAMKALTKNLLGQRTGPDEFELIRKDGRRVTVEISTFPVKRGGKVEVIGIARDITDRKRMENELRRYSEHLQELVEERTRELREAGRMAAIGEVAAMVGHDLRNPLQAITNAIYVLKQKLRRRPSKEDLEAANEMLSLMEESVGYADRIVEDLKAYSKTQTVHLETFNLNQTIQETLKAVKIPPEVTPVTKLDPETEKVVLDEGQMKRMLVNLFMNALDAMPQGGTLNVATNKEDDYVEIRVEDTGVGIPKEELRNLFKPFHTTKAKGTGLGLAICKKVVEAHGGSIEVESQEGKGSTFTIKLPVKKGGELRWKRQAS